MKNKFLYILFCAAVMCCGCSPKTMSPPIFTQLGLGDMRSSYWEAVTKQDRDIPVEDELRNEAFRAVGSLADSFSHREYWLCLYEYTTQLNPDAPFGHGVEMLCLFDDHFRYCGKYWLQPGTFYTFRIDETRVYCRDEDVELVLELRHGKLVAVRNGELGGIWDGIE